MSRSVVRLLLFLAKVMATILMMRIMMSRKTIVMALQQQQQQCCCRGQHATRFSNNSFIRKRPPQLPVACFSSSSFSRRPEDRLPFSAMNTRIPYISSRVIARLKMSANDQNQQQAPNSLESSTKAAPAAGGDDDRLLVGLNPSQVEAVTQPTAGGTITRVVAGPGSGKTRVLTCRIAYLLREEHDDRILAVTFTRKAAGEMQKRLENQLLSVQQQQQNQNNDRQQPEEPIPQSSLDNEGIIEEEEEDDSGRIIRRPPGLDRVTLGTFHSVCAKILRWNGPLLASLPSVANDMIGSKNETILDGAFAIADQTEQLRILRECLKDANIDLKQQDIRIMHVLNGIGAVKSMRVEGKDPLQQDNRNKKPISKAIEVAAKVFSSYREQLLATNHIDFDDILHLTKELLLQHDDVRQRLQQYWTHILIDEFQDTSRTQMDLVKLLTSSSLFIVGDADQSIYSWRGAHAASLSDIADEFQNHPGGVHTVYLMENYRSTSNIVKAAQKVISTSSGKTSPSSSDELRQSMKPRRGSGPNPRVVACQDDEAQANFILKIVKEKISTGEYGSDYSVACIYRTNAQSRALEEACVRNNVPYVIFGSATSFYKRQEIKDALCFLRWLFNGHDRGAMLRAMSTPKRGIGDSAIRQFDAYCNEVQAHLEKNEPQTKPTPFDVLVSLSCDSELPPGDAFPDPSETFSKRPLTLFKEFSQQMRALREKASTHSVEEVINSVIEDFSLIEHFDKISKSNAEFEERQANVEELQKAAQTYNNDGPCLPYKPDSDEEATGLLAGLPLGESNSDSPLGRFLDDVALVNDIAEEPDGPDEDRFVVRLMTIHASKGMEFDTVYSVGNEEGTIPTFQALQEGPGSVVFEEERRLCYVAMTRAKTELIMTWRKKVDIFTSDGFRSVDKERSQFLDVLVKSKGKKKKTATKDTPPLSLADRRQRLQERLQEQDTSTVYPTTRTKNNRKEPFTKKKTSNSARTYGRTQQKPVKLAARNPTKLEGTNNIYAKRRPIGMDLAGKPGNVDLGGKPRPERTNQRASRTTSNNQRSTTPVKSKPFANSKQQKIMDSTWFFPVGSEVLHKDYGRGIVLPPPTGGDLLVSVKFENGQQKEFDAKGSDLSIAF